MTFLNIDTENEIKLETSTLVGRSIAVLGITGSGKTNTASVLIEELLSNGFPLTIVDIEGEYWGLKEDYEIMVVGRSKNVDLEVGIEQAEKLAEFSVRKEISIILDLSDFIQSEMADFLLAYFKKLWEVCSEVRQPYEVILEEAHEFIPQGIRTPLKEVLTRIALRGRKRGLGITLISQRSAKVEKDVLTQASLMFLHRVIHPTDLKVYQDLIPLPARRVDEMVSQLQLGQAIVLFNHEAGITNIRQRHTFHVGATPSLNGSNLPKLRKIDKVLIEELKKLTSSSENKEGLNRNDKKVISRVKELEQIVLEKDNEIKKLLSQLSLLRQNNTSSKEKLSLGKNLSNPIPKNLTSEIIKNKNTQSSINQQPVKSTKNLLTEELVTKYEVNLSPAEELKLESFVSRIKKLPKLHRSILRVLTEHNDNSMNVQTIASWLAISESTVRSHPPIALIKMGLITRRRGSGGYRYTSELTSFLQSQFPNIEPEFFFRLFFL